MRGPYQTSVIATSESDEAIETPSRLNCFAKGLATTGKRLGSLRRAACFEQEPSAALGSVDEVFQKTRGRRILMLFRKLVAFAHGGGDHLVIVHQFAQHLVSGHELLIVVLDVLQLGDMPNGAQRRAADLAHPLGDFVGGLENLL